MKLEMRGPGRACKALLTDVFFAIGKQPILRYAFKRHFQRYLKTRKAHQHATADAVPATAPKWEDLLYHKLAG
eukprot:297889-Pelagomonas_calceolata.AAC.1